MPSDPAGKSEKPVEQKAILSIPCLSGCGKKFLPTKQKKKYCSRKCANHTSMRRWRDRQKPLFSVKNCQWCGDEFLPVRDWQRFCHRDCLVLWQNNAGRVRHEDKIHPQPFLETEDNVLKIKHGSKECSGGCNLYCKVIRRAYTTDRPNRVIAWQTGWSYDEKLDIILCSACQVKIAVVSDFNYKHKRKSRKDE